MTNIREDVLLDLYKIHAYIPNDAEGNPLTPFGNFTEGYKVAHEAQQKRIDELEKEIAKWEAYTPYTTIGKLEAEIKKWKENSVDIEYKCLDKNLAIEKLEARCKELEGALTKIALGEIYDQDIKDFCNEALSTKSPTEKEVK